MPEIDLTDLGDADLVDDKLEENPPAIAAATTAGPVEELAQAAAPAVLGGQLATPIIWDIETGPRPWEEIEQFYTPPGPIEPWDESKIRYGNAKDQAKRQEKRDQVRAEYDARVAGWAAEADAKRMAWFDKAALDPITGRVLAIGYLVDGQAYIVGGGGISEAELLENFWWGWFDRAAHEGRRMIGFNTAGFDLPFLARRSWLLDVDIPPAAIDQVRLYWSPVFVDLMRVWGLGSREFVKLDLVARYFGHAGKNGDGAEFGRLWFADRAQAVAYLENDLRMTAEVARSMRVF